MTLRAPEPISLDLLARHLQAIRNELREIKFNAENDRRNVRSQIDNLAATHASQLGDVEARMTARIDALETLLGERFGYLDERIGRVEERIGGVEETIAALEAHAGRSAERMEHLIALVERSLHSR